MASLNQEGQNGLFLRDIVLGQQSIPAVWVKAKSDYQIPQCCICKNVFPITIIFQTKNAFQESF
jgi:hypothetical protein